jgi:hypothetical protein
MRNILAAQVIKNHNNVLKVLSYIGDLKKVIHYLTDEHNQPIEMLNIKFLHNSNHNWLEKYYEIQRHNISYPHSIHEGFLLFIKSNLIEVDEAMYNNYPDCSGPDIWPTMG